MENELREKIAKWLSHNAWLLWHGDVSPKEGADHILSLLAPVIKDAEKWDKVKEIADNPCALNACPFFARCDDSPCLAEMIVDALTEKEE